MGTLTALSSAWGERNYRIVYGSLLAWVNDMPRTSAHEAWR